MYEGEIKELEAAFEDIQSYISDQKEALRDRIDQLEEYLQDHGVQYD